MKLLTLENIGNLGHDMNKHNYEACFLIGEDPQHIDIMIICHNIHKNGKYEFNTRHNYPIKSFNWTMVSMSSSSEVPD